MSSLPVTRHTVEEYLAMDEASEGRLEFVEGEIVAMAGGSERHSLLGANAIAALKAALRGLPCRVHSSDQRVQVETTGMFAYPDAVVVCGPPVPGPPRTFTNPSVLVEVLSPSTAHHDRGTKLFHYQQIRTLTDVVFVESWAVRVDHFRRVAENRWEQTIYVHLGETVTLECHGVELRVSELYEQFDAYPDVTEDDGVPRP